MDDFKTKSLVKEIFFSQINILWLSDWRNTQLVSWLKISTQAIRYHKTMTCIDWVSLFGLANFESFFLQNSNISGLWCLFFKNPDEAPKLNNSRKQAGVKSTTNVILCRENLPSYWHDYLSIDLFSRPKLQIFASSSFMMIWCSNLKIQLVHCLRQKKHHLSPYYSGSFWNNQHSIVARTARTEVTLTKSPYLLLIQNRCCKSCTSNNFSNK